MFGPVLSLSYSMDPRTELAVPIVPRDGIDVYNAQLGVVFTAEARAEEVAMVTPQKAPELLVLFNKAYLDLTKMVAQLRYESARAQDAVNKIKARILIDEVPVILKEKKLTNSIDMRNAIIDSNADYQAAKDVADRIDATVEYLKGKVKFMENAYTAVKKIVGEQQWNMVDKALGRQLAAGREADFAKPRHER